MNKPINWMILRKGSMFVPAAMLTWLTSAVPPNYDVDDMVNPVSGPYQAWRVVGADVTKFKLQFISPYGDYNGDGFADFLAGTKSNQNVNGYVKILSGKDGADLYTFVGDSNNKKNPNSNADFSFPRAGDFNGDGYPDVAIGVSRYGQSAGAIHVFLTDNSGKFTNDWKPGGYGSNDDFKITGESPNGVGGGLGYSMDLADLDGDGNLDIVAGEWKFTLGDAFTPIHKVGAAYAFSNCEITNGSHAAADTAHRIFSGDGCNQEFSFGLSRIADNDGNGRDEVAIGARFWWDEDLLAHPQQTYPDNPNDADILGKVYVFEHNEVECVNGEPFSGSDFTYVDLGNPERPEPSSGIIDNCQTGSLGNSLRNFGEVVVPIGDINKDGKVDLLVGTSRLDDVEEIDDEGRFWIYTYDDPSSSFQYHTPTYLQPDGTVDNVNFCRRASAIGDIDGDGYDDFAATDFKYKGAVGANKYGRVYVYSGRVVTGAFGTATQADPIFTITGEPENENQFGGEVEGVGDLNHDGIPDFAVGAGGLDLGLTEDVGAVYGIFTPTEDIAAVSSLIPIADINESDDDHGTIRTTNGETRIEVTFDVQTATGERVDYLGITVESHISSLLSIDGALEIEFKNENGGFVSPPQRSFSVKGSDVLVKLFEIANGGIGNQLVNSNKVVVRITHTSIESNFTSHYDKVTLVASRAPIPTP